MKLTKWLESNDAYKLLDSGKANGGTWCAGGCAILAFAINKHLGYPVYVLYDDNKKQIEHFVVKSKEGTYIDCDGKHNDIIGDFIEREYYDGDLSIMEYDDTMDAGEIPIDHNTIDKLVEVLKSKN